MAAYHICGLTGCAPVSASDPTLGNDYGITLPLPLLLIMAPVANVGSSFSMQTLYEQLEGGGVTHLVNKRR